MWHPKLATHPACDETSATPLNPDDAFEILSNRRRRYVIHHLLERSGATDLRALSRQVAAWENHKPLDRVTAEERRRVYNALQQFHLPKLRTKGVVSYDSDRGTVRSTRTAQSLRPYLDHADTSADCRTIWLASGALAAIAVLVAFTVVGFPTVGALLLVGAVGAVFLFGDDTDGRFGDGELPPELARETVGVER